MRKFLIVLGLLAPLAGPLAAKDLQTAVVAGGCFWCVEADFDKIEGVTETISGYAGGSAETATYKQVTRENTGHREAVKITFDADVISYERIIELFLRSIDPLDAGGQFCDRGMSYTTAIFTGSVEEAAIAGQEVAEAERQLGRELATEVVPNTGFYPAEGYHQDYYKKNPLRYSTYRKGCRRDRRVRQVWGDDAIFESFSS